MSFFYLLFAISTRYGGFSSRNLEDVTVRAEKRFGVRSPQ